jgi:8-oxo-dGTP pyrophosphatase MutT (NUDIX family)
MASPSIEKGAGILVFDERAQNYWFGLETSGKLGIPGGKKDDPKEGYRACAIRETSEETLQAIRSEETFKKILDIFDPKKVKEVDLESTIPKGAKTVQSKFVTYVISTELKLGHDPVKTFEKRRAKPGLAGHQQEFTKLIPVSKADLKKALDSPRPSIDGHSFRYCVLETLKKALKEKKLDL